MLDSLKRVFKSFDSHDVRYVVIALALLAGCQKAEPVPDGAAGDVGEPASRPAPLPDDSQKYNVTATKDANSPTGVYIPKNLRDAFAELDKMLNPALKEEFRKRPPRDVATEHHQSGLGLWIRNNWGLWAESRLHNNLRGVGLFHPDDMSSFLIESYCRYLTSPRTSDADYLKAFSPGTPAPGTP